MKAVVTGAGGFAGKWLCRHLLAEGWTVTGWIRRRCPKPVPGVRYRMVDIRDSAGVARAMQEDAPDEVFHLAAVTHVASCEEDPDHARATNVAGTVNVFSAMPATARGVFASTCHVYGRPESSPIPEDHARNGESVYAMTKLEAEKAVKELGRHVVIARAFHHTGPGQSTQYVLADWAAQIRRGARTLHVGDASVERDFTDVRDVVTGYAFLAREGAAGEAYNLCAGQAWPLSYFLGCLAEGRSVTIEVDPQRLRHRDVPRFCGDPTRAATLGWKPTRRIEETLAELLAAG